MFIHRLTRLSCPVTSHCWMKRVTWPVTGAQLALRFGKDGSFWHINAPETCLYCSESSDQSVLSAVKAAPRCRVFFFSIVHSVCLPHPPVGGQNLYRATEEGTHCSAGSGCFCVLKLQWVKVSLIRSFPLRLLIPFSGGGVIESVPLRALRFCVCVCSASGKQTRVEKETTRGEGGEVEQSTALRCRLRTEPFAKCATPRRSVILRAS